MRVQWHASRRLHGINGESHISCPRLRATQSVPLAPGGIWNCDRGAGSEVPSIRRYGHLLSSWLSWRYLIRIFGQLAMQKSPEGNCSPDARLGGENQPHGTRVSRRRQCCVSSDRELHLPSNERPHRKVLGETWAQNGDQEVPVREVDFLEHLFHAEYRAERKNFQYNGPANAGHHLAQKPQAFGISKRCQSLNCEL